MSGFWQGSYCVALVVCMGLGCSSQHRHSEHEPMGSVFVQTNQEQANRFVASNISNHLYMLALSPKDAFRTKAQRESLWAALRGENPRYLTLLGPVQDIPMDYRIEYVFNHTTPDSPDAELDNVRPWLKRLNKSDHEKVAKAQTILLVKGSLERLRNAQETRLTLAALTFLAETYDGVVFDLLNRQALSAQGLRQKLTDPNGLAPQVRLIGASVDGQRGIRSVGMPKYGLFDVFMASAQPRTAVKPLTQVMDALLEGRPLPDAARLERCRSTTLDYGCHRVLSR